VELLEDVAGVVLDGLGRDEQLLADLLVGQAPGGVLEYLAFALGESLVGAVVSISTRPPISRFAR
jgi:hypothetical protein